MMREVKNGKKVNDKNGKERKEVKVKKERGTRKAGDAKKANMVGMIMIAKKEQEDKGKDEK